MANENRLIRFGKWLRKWLLRAIGLGLIGLLIYYDPLTRGDGSGWKLALIGSAFLLASAAIIWVFIQKFGNNKKKAGGAVAGKLQSLGSWIWENGVGILGVIGAGFSLWLSWELRNPGPAIAGVGAIIFLCGAYLLIDKGKATWQQALWVSLLLIPLGVYLSLPRGQAIIVDPVVNHLTNVEVAPDEEEVSSAEVRSRVEPCPNVVVVRGDNISTCQLDRGRKITVLVGTGNCPYEEVDGIWFGHNGYGKWSLRLPTVTEDDLVSIGQIEEGSQIYTKNGAILPCPIRTGG